MWTAGTQIPVPASLFEDPIPTIGTSDAVCPGQWPHMEKFDFDTYVPGDTTIDKFIGEDWKALLATCAAGRENEIFHRFPASADMAAGRPRTVDWELPIILDCGTSSYHDTEVRLNHMQNHIAGRFIVLWGDGQTFLRDTWFKVKWPDKFPTMCTFAGELHGRFHVQAADLRMNMMLIYQPLFMHFGVRGFTGKTLPMKSYGGLETWTFIFLAGTLRWLRKVYTEAELQDPKKLLQQVRLNLPVSNQIGWALHFGAFIFGNMKAVRISDSDRLDFMWRYSCMMYSMSNKFQYRTLCLMNSKLLEDCEPNVRALVKKWRTYTAHGRPCSGGELDMLRERVSTC